MATDRNRKSRSSSSSSPPFSPSYYYSSIDQMNQDHLISILQLLPVDSVLSFSMTCKKFRSLGSSDSLWESICRREWGNTQLNGLVATLPEKRSISWRRLYQQVSQMGSLSCCRLSGKDGILPEPRASHSLNWVDDYLVLFGGGCQGGKHLDDTWVAYVGNDDVKRTIDWQLVQMDGRPSGRFGHTCIVVDNLLVMFGGINDNGIRQNDTWVGQLVRDGSSSGLRLSWKLLDVGSVAPCPRGAHAGCSIGEKKMVIHGGIGLNGIRLDDAWVLDIANGHDFAGWQAITVVGPSPPARSGHSLTWIGGNRMILFGGRGTGYHVLNDVWLFELGEECSEWTKVMFDSSNSLGWVPLPRVGHSAVQMLGGRLLIYGGEDSYRRRKDDFWVLDVSKLPMMVRRKTEVGKMWRRLKAEGQEPERRSFHTACADMSGRYCYIFGGMVDGVLNPSEAYGLRFDGGFYLVELVLQS